MSEGVDLIDIYAEEEFNQVRGCVPPGGAIPLFGGQSSVTGVSQLISEVPE